MSLTWENRQYLGGSDPMNELVIMISTVHNNANIVKTIIAE